MMKSIILASLVLAMIWLSSCAVGYVVQYNIQRTSVLDGNRSEGLYYAVMAACVKAGLSAVSNGGGRANMFRGVTAGGNSVQVIISEESSGIRIFIKCAGLDESAVKSIKAVFEEYARVNALNISRDVATSSGLE